MTQSIATYCVRPSPGGLSLRSLSKRALGFFDRSIDTVTFKRGMNAHNNPGFYRQLGKDPEQLTQAALELLAKKLKL
jgi:hypothetical protein